MPRLRSFLPSLWLHQCETNFVNVTSRLLGPAGTDPLPPRK
jgi:hypothetical protein